MEPKPIGGTFPFYDADAMNGGRPSKSDRSDFAERLRALREAAGLSQREMAAQLGIAQPSYVAWETYNVALKPEQIEELAGVLGVTVAELFGGSGNGSRKRGPAGKVQRVFEEVSRLPRGQQNKIVEFVEAFVAQQGKSS